MAVEALDVTPASSAATTGAAVAFDEATVACISAGCARYHLRPVDPHLFWPAFTLAQASVEGGAGLIAVAVVETAIERLVGSDRGEIERSDARLAQLPTPQLPAPS